MPPAGSRGYEVCLTSFSLRDRFFHRVEQLIQPERFVKHQFQARLPGFDDRMARIVAEAGHQHQRHGIENFLQLQQQFVAVDDRAGGCRR